MKYVFLPLLAIVTSIVAYLLAVRLWKRRSRDFRPAVARALEILGLVAVFFVANLAVGLLLVLLVRSTSGYFISAYILNDGTLVILSVVQGIVAGCWRRAGNS